MSARHAWVVLVLSINGCPDPSGDVDGGAADVLGSDVPGADAPLTDVPGLDAPGLDAPGLDAPASDGGSTMPDTGVPDPACALAPPIDADFVPGRTLYVAPGGSGDGSDARPFGTLDAALDAATPGTRVVVRAGTYGPLDASDISGTDGAPIVISGEPGAILEARGAGAVIRMTDPEWVVIEGFELRGATVHGINIDDGGSYDTPAHHLVLRDLTIPSAGSGGNNDCIKLSGVDDFWVLGSDVAHCDRGEIIDMVGCHRGVIAGNHFHDTAQSGVQTKGGSSDVLITGNTFADIPSRGVNAGGSTGLEFFRPLDADHEARNIRVVANVLARVGADGGAPVAFVGCDACTFEHNTVIDPGVWVVRILQESDEPRFVPSRDGVFANNVVVLDSESVRAMVNVGGGTAPETFTFRNNLWFSYADAGWRPSLGSGIPAETGAIVGMDPRLVDRAGGDFRLRDDSPAIGAAGAAAAALPPDRDGRCYAEPASLGAYER